MSDKVFSHNSNQVTFQWGGTIFALFLLILNCTGRRSRIVTSLLVVYLLTSFPNAIFKILRGQFGQWISFIAIAAKLFFPHIFPVSRFILFVITPEWLVGALRFSIFGSTLCLVIGVFLIVLECRVTRDYGTCRCSFSCFCYFTCTALLLFFSIYLFVGYL